MRVPLMDGGDCSPVVVDSGKKGGVCFLCLSASLFDDISSVAPFLYELTESQNKPNNRDAKITN